MSLLIKALDKAEKAQEAQQQKLQKESRRQAKNIANDADVPDKEIVHLELEQPLPSTMAGSAAAYDNAPDTARAANVFEAKYATNTGVNPLVWIAGLGLLGLLGVGYYFYAQLNSLQTQPAVMHQPSQTNQDVPPTLPQPDMVTDGLGLDETTLPTTSIAEQSQPKSQVAASSFEAAKTASTEAATVDKKPLLSANEEQVAETEVAKLRPEPRTSVNANPTKVFGAPIASESASIQISRSSTEQGVNPTLLSAYNAYNAGQDAEAQALYKKVLQKDVHNVDALLGLGAIAERQGRQNDALGWFRKVLEVEPRNAIALSAFYDNEQNSQDKESKLKSLTAKNPNDFNAYADLGTYYAEQGRWIEAQQSFFEAYRLNVTADNAFNLAVSLDQMHKPKLALPYYQQALDLIKKSPTFSFDQSILQSRIQAIQEK